MIRIDLGKVEGEKRNTGGSLQSRLANMKGLQGSKFGKQLESMPGGTKGAIIVAVAGALACLPHLFFTQYQGYMEDQHTLRMKKLEERSVLIDSEIQKLTPFKTEMESYEQQKKLVRDRLEVVRELLLARGTPVNVLDAIGQSLPQRSWVRTLVLALSPTSSKATLDGQAYSNEEVSDFIDKLNESVHLGEVRLEEMSTARVDGGQVELRSYKVSAIPRVRFPALGKLSEQQGGTPVQRGAVVTPVPPPADPASGAVRGAATIQ